MNKELNCMNCSIGDFKHNLCDCDNGFCKEFKSIGTQEDFFNTVMQRIRPQGEWIESFKRFEVKRGAYLGTTFIHDGWSCSECSEVVEKRYPNCPYCLARMKGADDGMDAV